MWTKGERDALERHFRNHIRIQRVPGKLECDAAKKAEPQLAARTWQNIKFAVKNAITKNIKFAVNPKKKTRRMNIVA